MAKYKATYQIGTQSRTQSLEAFRSAGQRREDSGDINLIDFFIGYAFLTEVEYQILRQDPIKFPLIPKSQ